MKVFTAVGCFEILWLLKAGGSLNHRYVRRCYRLWPLACSAEWNTLINCFKAHLLCVVIRPYIFSVHRLVFFREESTWQDMQQIMLQHHSPPRHDMSDIAHTRSMSLHLSIRHTQKQQNTVSSYPCRRILHCGGAAYELHPIRASHTQSVVNNTDFPAVKTQRPSSLIVL